MQRKLILGLALSSLVAMAAPSFAGVTLGGSLVPGVFDPGAVIQSAAVVAGSSGVYQTGGVNGNATPAGPLGNGTGQYKAWSQTFTTGAIGFKLDKFAFGTIAGQSGSGTNGLSVQIYQTSPGGGNGVGGFVDVANGTALLATNLTVTMPGQGTEPEGAVRTFDLTGSDEITLAANTQYTIDLVLNGNTTASNAIQFARQSTNPVGPGNGHATGSSTAGGQRFGLSGSDVDYTFAVYSTIVPEPTSAAVLLGAAGMLRRRRR